MTDSCNYSGRTIGAIGARDGRRLTGRSRADNAVDCGRVTTRVELTRTRPGERVCGSLVFVFVIERRDRDQSEAAAQVRQGQMCS